MAIDALVKPFLRLPLFQGLRPLQLTEIVRRAERIVYKAGDIIIEEDKVGDAAVVIVSGEAVLVRGSEGANAEPIIEGSIVGELAMLVETVHTATVLAKTSVRALRLTREEMHDLMATEPGIAEHLTQKITSRLHVLAGELRSIDQALAEISAYDPFVVSPSAQTAQTSAAMH